MQNDPRFPIGTFDRDASTPRAELIQTIETLPTAIAASVAGLSDEQLDTPYREGGWTLRQTVHHVADSHMNAYIRFKLALTEDVPTIRPYFEDRWADLADSKRPVNVSLKLIEGIHERWANILDSMTNADYERELEHPDSGRWTLDKLLSLYAWHSRHHTAHITRLRSTRNW
ncbi:MAG: YfiT family bacillithiol transferase [Acidobacteriota bacterium]